MVRFLKSRTVPELAFITMVVFGGIVFIATMTYAMIALR